MMEDQIKEAAETFFKTGSATIKLENGKRIFFVISTNLSMPSNEQGIMIACEGSGCYFLDRGVVPNQYTLFRHGFSAMVSPIVLRILQIFRQQHELTQSSRLVEHRTTR